ncbi:hypothetical protein D3C86_1969040 [compost metagenome]
MISVTAIHIRRTSINNSISSNNSISVVIYCNVSASVNVSGIAAYVGVSIARISNVIIRISVRVIGSIANLCV